jgi:hypothetical protein
MRFAAFLLLALPALSTMAGPAHAQTCEAQRSGGGQVAVESAVTRDHEFDTGADTAGGRETRRGVPQHHRRLARGP